MIVIVVISAMAYFGVDPTGLAGKYLPSKCVINEPGLSCLDHSVSEEIPPFGPHTNTLQLALRNNMGFRIQITRIEVPSTGAYILPFNLYLDNSQDADLDEIAVDNIGSGALLYESGEDYELDVVITIVNTESGLEHQFTSKIRGKVV